ncbi:MAG: HYR domain-containing protein [Bacteroidia bacterium]
MTYTAPGGADNCRAGHHPDRRTRKRRRLPSQHDDQYLPRHRCRWQYCDLLLHRDDLDTQLPTITCPTNITGNNDPGQCSKVVTFTAPVGADNCPGPITAPDAGLASGAAFPVGTTTNTFRVTDAAGNTATCSFTVSITDTQCRRSPAPPASLASNDNGQCSKVVSFTAPVGADNCPGPVAPRRPQDLPAAPHSQSGQPFLFRVTDAAGNTATCSFTVSITDNQLPTITCRPTSQATMTPANAPRS